MSSLSVLDFYARPEMEGIEHNRIIESRYAIRCAEEELKKINSKDPQMHMYPCQYIQSPSGRFRLIYQKSGDLIIHDIKENITVWRAGVTVPNPMDAVLYMNVLVLRDTSGEIYWPYKFDAKVVNDYILRRDSQLIYTYIPGVSRGDIHSIYFPDLNDDGVLFIYISSKFPANGGILTELIHEVSCAIKPWKPGVCYAGDTQTKKVISDIQSVQSGLGYKGVCYPDEELEQKCASTTPRPVVDCEADVSYSACSFNGEKRVYVNAITQKPQNGGKPCPISGSIIKCPVNCTMGWGPCSSATHRQDWRMIHPPLNGGKCPNQFAYKPRVCS